MPTAWKSTKIPTLSIRLDQAGPNHVHINAAEDGKDGQDSRAFAIGGADDFGFRRSTGIKPEQAADLGMPLDDNGCIALHPNDPAMVRIQELEAQVIELESANKSAMTRAQELSRYQCEALRRVYASTPAADYADVRAMVAAYEVMRNHETQEGQ